MDMNLVVGVVLGLTVVFVFGICLFGDWAARKRRERYSEDFREHQGQIPTSVDEAC
jgi:small basic protein